MFHHFPTSWTIADCLVRSTDLDYSEGPLASFIAAMTQSGYAQQPDGPISGMSLP